MISESMDWSRREDLNPPSAVYDTAALALSYTGSCLKVYSLAARIHQKVITPWGRSPRRPRCSLSLTLTLPSRSMGRSIGASHLRSNPFRLLEFP